MKKILFIITFFVLGTNFAIAQNNQVKFPLKKSDYLNVVKKNLEASWAFGKDEINLDEYSAKLIKIEEEGFKQYIANLKNRLEQEFKALSNNKSALSKSDYINAVTKKEESNFDLEDANRDGVITEEEHKSFIAKQKKSATPKK